MNLSFDFFYDDIISTINFNVSEKNCIDIIYNISKKYNKSTKYINIYQDDKLLKNTFNNWDNKYNYIIFIDNSFINIIVKYNNKNIRLPQLDLNTKISEIKNILSIEEDIFFRNIRLENKNTLSSYKINNNNILTTYAVTDSVKSVT